MTHLKRVSVLSLAMASFFVFVMAQSAMAIGTASGITISNRATISFEVNSVPQNDILSVDPINGTDATTFIVDNVVNLTVHSVNNTSVIPGTSNVALRFTITNTGNTIQGYSLSELVVGGTMLLPRIYLDSTTGGIQGSYDHGVDPEYTTGSNIGDLDPNTAGAEVATVFIVANAPSTATANGLTDTYSLVATTLNAGTTTQTEPTNGPNTNGLDVVFADSADGTRNGQDSASGSFIITSASLTINKTSEVISDPFNLDVNPKAIPGATVQYTISITNSGTQDADSVDIVDEINANMTFVDFVDTLTLNSNSSAAISRFYSTDPITTDHSLLNWLTAPPTDPALTPVTFIKVVNDVIDRRNTTTNTDGSASVVYNATIE